MEGKWTDRNELDKINELFDEKIRHIKQERRKKWIKILTGNKKDKD